MVGYMKPKLDYKSNEQRSPLLIGDNSFLAQVISDETSSLLWPY